MTTTNTKYGMRYTQKVFLYGEISPFLWNGIFQEPYQNGSRIINNMLITPTGTLVKRPGTIYGGTYTLKPELISWDNKTLIFDYDTNTIIAKYNVYPYDEKTIPLPDKIKDLSIIYSTSNSLILNCIAEGDKYHVIQFTDNPGGTITTSPVTISLPSGVTHAPLTAFINRAVFSKKGRLYYSSEGSYTDFVSSGAATTAGYIDLFSAQTEEDIILKIEFDGGLFLASSSKYFFITTDQRQGAVSPFRLSTTSHRFATVLFAYNANTALYVISDYFIEKIGIKTDFNTQSILIIPFDYYCSHIFEYKITKISYLRYISWNIISLLRTDGLIFYITIINNELTYGGISRRFLNRPFTYVDLSLDAMSAVTTFRKGKYIVELEIPQRVENDNNMYVINAPIPEVSKFNYLDMSVIYRKVILDSAEIDVTRTRLTLDYDNAKYTIGDKLEFNSLDSGVIKQITGNVLILEHPLLDIPGYKNTIGILGVIGNLDSNNKVDEIISLGVPLLNSSMINKLMDVHPITSKDQITSAIFTSVGSPYKAEVSLLPPSLGLKELILSMYACFYYTPVVFVKELDAIHDPNEPIRSETITTYINNRAGTELVAIPTLGGQSSCGIDIRLHAKDGLKFILLGITYNIMQSYSGEPQ